MTDFNIRRRLAEDGQTPEEIDEAMSTLAEAQHDQRRDREAEEHFEKNL